MTKRHHPIPEAGQQIAAPISRVLRTDELEDGAELTVEASPAERAAIAELLGLLALNVLSYRGRVQRLGQGRLLVAGTLKAQAVQSCVVSLDPVESVVEMPVETAFWPEAQLQAFTEDTEEAMRLGPVDWPEPIRDGKIDLGPLVYETLATAIDPYPRREGAHLDWQGDEDGTADAAGARGSFAVLESLKKDL